MKAAQKLHGIVCNQLPVLLRLRLTNMPSYTLMNDQCTLLQKQKKSRPKHYAKLPTAKDVFGLIPDLISCIAASVALYAPNLVRRLNGSD